MPDTLLTHQFFAPLVGVSFATAAGDDVIPLRLEDVTPLPSPRRRSLTGKIVPVEAGMVRREPFSLMFVGPPDPVLPQAIYRMTAPEAGETPLEIFIVPLGPEDGGIVYQAIFA